MSAKKRKAKAAKPKAAKKPLKRSLKKPVKKAAPQPKPVIVPVPKALRETAMPVEFAISQEAAAQEFFAPAKPTFGSWVRRYSPVLVTSLIALLTYFYLVFYLFYPTTLIQGHYLQLLLLIVFIFLIAGLLIYLGLRAELLFMRILSFIFVFIIFTFLLLFILIAHSMGVAP